MSTQPRSLRRGLPRVPGGEPWPPAGAAPVTAAESDVPPAGGAEAAPDPVAAASATDVAPASASVPGAAAGARTGSPPLRRGLPRVPGGTPWPPESSAPAAARAVSTQQRREDAAPPVASPLTPSPGTPTDSAPAGASGAAAAGIPVRRGLPRAPGGEPWPPAGTLAAPAAVPPVGEAVPDAAPPAAASVPPAAGVAVADAATEPRAPLPFPRTVWAGVAATAPRASATEPTRIGPFTRLQWAGTVVVGGTVLLIVAGMAVALVRWLLSTDPLQEFLGAYPGEYHLPERAPVGLPAWLGWQHFLNTFFLLLIIRTGLQVRRDKRPSAFWSPRWNPKRKISLSLWFHQSLDILWIVNGVAFVVLLFVTGQWMRIVPTSWEVFPNALSAALQYVSLDWPTENGWVNYNSLQQLAYFTTVFVAAPLAIVTGVRMSGIWPARAATLNRLYPVEWARKVHFPVMLYFVAFTVVHVGLVFATGALRNLNHMYAAQGSVDPDAYAENWAGFWIFVASVVVIAIAWIAARPLVLAPIARLFGTVKGR